ncbi:hypothetical protein BXZ70DRAFT_385305 [Cristinia sonorae]|uniref:Zn(2)-C6 fungal-type domain-containing protein n=1 Tax=Cristinia sonorae TaxID=1940300 RepID=A0A8K0UJG0_9AGAR|nr:hypothetical protein BXZ70DRAFT_385305 [Cristinia sonorae]
MSIPSSSARGISHTPPLERGKACLRCRRRKMKCDGARPMCTQCVRSDQVECEYTDGTLTGSQILEQNVAHLEARIRELEGKAGESITLHDPHSTFSQAQSRPSATVTVPSGVPRGDPSGRWQVPEVLLDSFVNHAYAFGFFLNMPRFLARISRAPQDQSVPPVIQYAVYLIGLLTSQDPLYVNTEPRILSLSMAALAAAVSNIQPEDLLYILQTEILLSNYFFHKDRRLEGAYHVTAAVSFVLGSNLHQITDWKGTGAVSTAAFQLPMPADAIEQGERINAFWTVFCLDRCWSVALGSHSALARRNLLSAQILTPLPFDMIDYEQGLLPELSTVPTIQKLLTEQYTDITHFTTARAMVVILFSEAVSLTSDGRSDDPNFRARVASLEEVINQYKRNFSTVLQHLQTASEPSPAASGSLLGRPYAARCALYIQTLIICTEIKLHAPLDQDQGVNTILSHALQAADILQDLDVTTVGYVDPFLGVMWTIVGQVLVHALMVERSMQPVGTTASSERDTIIQNALGQIINVMEALTVADPTATLLAHELRNLRQQQAMLHST